MLLGNKPTWNVNSITQTWNSSPINSDNWFRYESESGDGGWLRAESFPRNNSFEFMLILMGPVFSLVLAISSTIFLNYNSFKQLIFSFISILSPLLYYLRGPFRSYGDEYIVANYL